MKTLRRTSVLAAGAAGASLAYLLDPQQGRRRRAVLADRLGAMARRTIRRAETKARYLEGRMEGVVYRVTPKGAHGAEGATGALLADKVRSEILGRPPFNDYVIAVDAVGHEVHLRGEIENPDVVRRLREAVEAMPEVDTVENLIHPPGTTAPNKAAAWQAS